MNSGELKTAAPVAPILEVEDLRVHLRTDHGVVRAVEGASLKVAPGQSLGVVGESGCGKSMTALAIMGLIPPRNASYAGGHIRYHTAAGETLDITTLDLKGKVIRGIRGNEIAMIFQEPMTSLNPVYTIGEQIVEGIILHQNVDRSTARERAIDMLDRVEIPAARQRYSDYPHQLSGGMRQRVMIAMALSCNPRLLIADEPTTALDVTIQAQILELIKELQRELDMALVMITHDLGVVREVAERISVMYLGKIVEEGPVADVFATPSHPYTRALLQTIPRIGQREKLVPIRGTVPSPIIERRGCDFAPRCDDAHAKCLEKAPSVFKVGEGHDVRCWLHEPGDEREGVQ